MRILRNIYANINLLNILLFATVVTLVVFAVMPMFHLRVKYTLPMGKARITEGDIVSSEKSQAPLPLDYAMIGENNLFHSDRRIPPEKKVEIALPKPEIVLYGTVITDGVSIAYIEDKKSPKFSPGRGKRQSVVKKGDLVGGFVLKEVSTDNIVLSRGEEMMVVHLTDATKQRESQPGPIQAKLSSPAAAFAAPGTPTSALTGSPFPTGSVASPAMPARPVPLPPSVSVPPDQGAARRSNARAARREAIMGTTPYGGQVK